jgi:hypothetical protein
MMYRSTLSVVVFAALVGCGDDDDGYDETVNSQILSLQDAMIAQNETIEALQEVLETQKETITALQDKVETNSQNIAAKASKENFLVVKEQVDTLQRYMIVDTAENTVTFEGANVHIVSGSGTNNDGGTYTGLGNLQIGYDSTSGLSGSHNVSIGQNTAESHGSLLVGRFNVSKSKFNVVFGIENEAGDSEYGEYATILGGSKHTNLGQKAVIVGGQASTIDGYNTAVSTIVGGGWNKMKSGSLGAVIIGGRYNEANSDYSVDP